MVDLWKDIKGYEGKYQVSYEGKIRRLYKGREPRELTPYLKTHGRKILFIGLTKGGTDYIINIQPLCRNCNSKKWANDNPELIGKKK